MKYLFWFVCWVGSFFFGQQGHAVFHAFEGQDKEHILSAVKGRIHCLKDHYDDIVAYSERFNQNTSGEHLVFIQPLSKPISALNHLLKKLNKVDMNNPDSIEKGLFYTLEERFDQLHGRYIVCEIDRKIANPSICAIHFGFTYPEIYPALTDIEQKMATLATDIYQTYTFACLGLIGMVDDLKTLSDETKTLLTCSKALWPLLQGEKRDLGHPDEVIYERLNGPVCAQMDAALFERHVRKSMNCTSDSAADQMVAYTPFEFQHAFKGNRATQRQLVLLDTNSLFIIRFCFFGFLRGYRQRWCTP